MSFGDQEQAAVRHQGGHARDEGGRSEHRRVMAQFRCMRGQVFFVYQREMPSGEIGYAALVRAAAATAT